MPSAHSDARTRAAESAMDRIAALPSSSSVIDRASPAMMRASVGASCSAFSRALVTVVRLCKCAGRRSSQLNHSTNQRDKRKGHRRRGAHPANQRRSTAGTLRGSRAPTKPRVWRAVCTSGVATNAATNVSSSLGAAGVAAGGGAAATAAAMGGDWLPGFSGLP